MESLKKKLGILFTIIFILIAIFGAYRAYQFILLVKIANNQGDYIRSGDVNARVTISLYDGSENIYETHIQDGITVNVMYFRDKEGNVNKWTTWEDPSSEEIYTSCSSSESNGERYFSYSNEVKDESEANYYPESLALTLMGQLSFGYGKNAIPASNALDFLYRSLCFPNIKNGSYNGRECYIIDVDESTRYIDKETLLTFAYEILDNQAYTFEYDVQEPERIYEVPRVGEYNEVYYSETIEGEDRYPKTVDVAISNTNLKPGEELIEVVKIKENEELNFLDLITGEDFGINGFNIRTFETYEKLRENYSNLRALTEEDFENYFVGIAFKEGYTLNCTQVLEGSGRHYIFKTTPSDNEETLNLIVTPKVQGNYNSRYVENNKGKVIDVLEAERLSNIEIKKAYTDLVLDEEGYINHESYFLDKLTFDEFAQLEKILTPVQGQEPLCWKTVIKDAENRTITVFVDAINSKVVGLKEGYVE